MNNPQNTYKNLNSITTTKYTVQNFVFKNIQEQFSKLPNIYFLVISVLQVIPETSSTDGVPVVLPSLFMMVIISMLKDLFEDMKRQQSDFKENASDVKAQYNCCYTNKNWSDISRPNGCRRADWKDLQPGMVVQLEENEWLPADVIILYSSDEKGSVFVETKTLDGESAHKQRHAVPLTSNIIDNLIREDNHQDIRGIESIRLLLEFDTPNDELNRFHGAIQMLGEDDDDKKQIENVNKNNILLRGSSIKSTRWMLGIVTQTGHQTKIMMNCISAQSKFSAVFKFMNTNVVQIFFLQISICMFLGLMCTVQDANATQEASQGDSYYPLPGILNTLKQFGSWTILSTNFVPISLMVTLEFISLLQTQFLVRDQKFYDPELEIGCEVQSSNLHEELGQIDTVFTDKTGTLTKNEMKLKAFYTNNTEQGKIFDSEFDRGDTANCISNEQVDFYDTKVKKDQANQETNKELIEFILSTTICHSIITDNFGNQVAQSPEELSLVSFASEMGIKFIDRNFKDGSINLVINGTPHCIILKAVIEFSSERKCMSVLVEHQNRQLLQTKGADNVILKKMSKLCNSQPYLDVLEKWSTNGLRTLLQGMRQLPKKDANEFIKEYTQIQSNSQMVERRKELEHKIERNLTLIGAVAIEDKLQDEVAEVLSQFKHAGIKINMLTGDKLQTAINIGKACKIIEEETIIQVINFNEKTGMFKRMKQIQNEIGGIKQDQCLVLSGDCYSLMYDDAELQKELGKTMNMVDSLICCRLSPKQKALLINKQKEVNKEAIVLAIGDGANDVNMISMANVGVGIQGKEGIQAARASDYAISEFKFLRRLLFSYGSEFQRKNSNSIIQFFYKNMMVTSPQFFFGVWSLFTHGIFQDTFQQQSFNVFYTSWPVIFFAMYDRMKELDTLEQDITVMRQGHAKKQFNQRAIWKEIIFGLIMASSLTLLQVTCASQVQGANFGFNMSNTVQFSVITCVSLDLLVRQQHHTWFTLVIILMSVCFFFVANFGFIMNMRAGRYQLNNDFHIWFNLESGLFIGLSLLVNVTLQFVFQAFFGVINRLVTTDTTKLEEAEQDASTNDLTMSRKLQLDKLSKNKQSQNQSKLIKTNRASYRKSLSPTKLEHFSNKKKLNGTGTQEDMQQSLVTDICTNSKIKKNGTYHDEVQLPEVNVNIYDFKSSNTVQV